MNIHEYLKGHGFELTEEFRKISEDEYFLDATGAPSRWRSIYQSAGFYLVLRKLPKTFEFDGQTFPVPDGYVFERVGIPQEKDIGKYIASAPNGRVPIHTVNEKLVEYLICPYFIFRKENE